MKNFTPPQKSSLGQFAFFLVITIISWYLAYFQSGLPDTITVPASFIGGLSFGFAIARLQAFIKALRDAKLL